MAQNPQFVVRPVGLYKVPISHSIAKSNTDTGEASPTG
jgi:hypothetical protein